MIKFPAEENKIAVPASIAMPPFSTIRTAKERWQCAANSARFVGQQTLSMRNRANSLMMPGFPSQRHHTENVANVVTCYHMMIGEFKFYLLPLHSAEGSVLIQHCKTLMQNKQDNLCTRVLQTLCRMCSCSKQNFTEQGQQLRLKLLQRYFGPHGRVDRQQQMLGDDLAVKCECRLNDAGASDLVIDIIINEPSSEIFLKAMHLAKALLLEGNDKVQQSFYNRLRRKDAHEPFFKAISHRIQTAQNRLKSDMMSCNESKPKGGKNGFLFITLTLHEA
ncbi:unnamed protein product [Nippostrongylus brasiliensis]|uniref:Inositol 1,4,5-trisphosphate receptor, putative (inferred by orthology to a S. mansoni protein) n=1 Tax=Nippostrongylus brasiliensis TaxID=27835 RepID=A0A0N4YU74_NIPBR|nr:unnamed protein product [Nippostrongylus brasiliensis]